MIITKSPLRVSLLGGGADIPEFYEKEPAVIFGGGINQHVYVISNQLSKFSKEKFRFTYRITESVLSPNDFEHPVLKTALMQFTDIRSINLTTFSDIPGRTGLGSSSAFTVALLGNLHALTQSRVTNKDLALEAINIERVNLKEAGGVQDQLHTAIGGLRFYEISESGISISDNFCDSEFYKAINQSMLLVRVGEFRNSHVVHFSQKSNKPDHKILKKIRDIAKYFQTNFRKDELSLDLLAECMNETWKLKKSIDSRITNDQINEVIDIGLKKGAQAAKLCGAGESGFVLFIAPPEVLIRLIEVFSEEKCQKVEFTCRGFEEFRYSELY